MRLGAVSYLNVRPLVYGLEQYPDRVSVRFDVPSVCAERLADGSIDLGMVPSIAHLDRPDDRIVPGVCIGSKGPVASVALFTRMPLAAVRTIALDTSSRTSAVLTRILCARRFGIAPAFVPAPPDLDAMLAGADAALLIGDPALFLDAPGRGLAKIDLGAEWTAMTGLPFVWAFWAGRSGAADAATVQLLQASADAGMAHADEVADAYCAGAPERQPLARQYLRDHLAFRFDVAAVRGLTAYYREAAAIGLVTEAGPLRFFDEPARPGGCRARPE
ncbi:MAG TPA: menaquinone biosynthesis protein [Vicinamibacterales bacterium]|nr:menaquinone biosynthesis protein [Vicinamibacterales bacterium]